MEGRVIDMHKHMTHDVIFGDSKDYLAGIDGESNGHLNTVNLLRNINPEEYLNHPRHNGYLRLLTANENLELAIKETEERRKFSGMYLQVRGYSEFTFDLPSGVTCSGLAYDENSKDFIIVSASEDLMEAKGVKRGQWFMPISDRPKGNVVSAPDVSDEALRCVVDWPHYEGSLDRISSAEEERRFMRDLSPLRDILYDSLLEKKVQEGMATEFPEKPIGSLAYNFIIKLMDYARSSEDGIAISPISCNYMETHSILLLDTLYSDNPIKIKK